LFYGFLLNSDEEPNWDNPEWTEEDREDYNNWMSWEDEYARRCGIKEPEEQYPTGAEQDTSKGKNILKKYHASWEKKNRIIEKEPCEIGYHCSDDCTEYYVCVGTSEVTALRGYPEKINPEKIKKSHPRWDAQLQQFCKFMGIKAPKTFGWYLVSCSASFEIYDSRAISRKSRMFKAMCYTMGKGFL
jgi:hypothetical protein